MSLRNVPIITRDVTYGGHAITVRGVGVADIATILPLYGAEVALLFGQVAAKGSSLSEMDIATVFHTILARMPALAAEVIALVCDDHPQGIEVARRLPIGTQLEIFEAAFECTFASESDLEKLLGVVNRFVLGAATMIQKATPALPSDGGGST